MRTFARRLIHAEALEHKSSESERLAVFPIYDKLRPHLATLMGDGGFLALQKRALALARAEAPELRTVQVKGDGAFVGWDEYRTRLAPAQFSEGRVVLLAQLLGLLVVFVGPKLTSHLVGEVWPKTPFNDLDLANGLKTHDCGGKSRSS